LSYQTFSKASSVGDKPIEISVHTDRMIAKVSPPRTLGTIRHDDRSRNLFDYVEKKDGYFALGLPVVYCIILPALNNGTAISVSAGG
jgi:hypothetical protein